MTRFKILLAVLLLICAALPLMAQEQTGSVEGVIKDASGGVLPGVTVEATSPKTGTMNTVSGGNGEYRFPRLPSGRYDIKATLMGYKASSVRNVEITLGKVATINLTLEVAAVAETITVTAEAPLVNVATSATTTSIAREQLELLPKGRDFTSVVNLAAGSQQENFLGGISVEGASGAENRFVIDGIDTTHPETGVSAQEVITDFVEEVQVKTAGYAAEFGGSLGGVVNAVTKSGSNAFHGSLFGYMTDSSWNGAVRPTYYAASPTLYKTYKKDKDSSFDPGFSFSGPIATDKAWFYFGYQPQFRTIDRTPEGSSTTYTQDIKQQYYLANITGNLGSKFLYRASANLNPYKREGVLPAQDGSTPSNADLTVNREIPTQSYSLHMDYVPTSRFFFSGRYGVFSTDTNDTGLEGTAQYVFVSPTVFPGDKSDPRYRPTGFSSLPTFFQTNKDKWDRNSASLDGTTFFDLLGSHELKGGIQTEKIKNNVNDSEVGNNFRIRWNTARYGVKGTYGSVEVRSFETIGSAEMNNQAIFLQDSWRIIPTFVFNYGVRAEQEKVPNYPINQPLYGKYAWTWDWKDKMAPRLGFAWDILGNQKMKAYGSWGKYYDITKLAMPRGSFGADRWIAYVYPLNTLDWETLGNGCHRSTNNKADNPCPNLGTPGTVRDLRLPSNPADSIDPNLKPMSQREYQLGFDYGLTGNSVLGLRYVNKQLLNTIEDIGYLVETEPGSGQYDEHYITGNPGKGVVGGDPAGIVPAQPEAVRKYEALEFSYNRRFVKNWSLQATYTYSKLRGNYSGLASSDEFGRLDPNIERYFDSLINGFDDQGKLVIGPLNTDRPHVVEVEGVYRLSFGTTFGVNTSWRSGTPVSEEAYWFGVPYFPNGRGNLGRTPNLSQTDLLITQPFRIGNYTLEANLNVMNLFDQKTVTRIGNNHWVEDVCEDAMADTCDYTYEQFFSMAPFDTNKLMTDAHAQVYPSFGKALSYQSARTVRLGLRFTF